MNRQKRPWYLSFLILLLACWTNSIQAKPVIKWVWFAQQPYHTGVDLTTGQGVVDRLTQFYQNNLPAYQHVAVRVNAKRYPRMLDQANICIPIAWLSPMEKQHLIQTKVHTLEPPVGVYVHKSQQQRFGDPAKEQVLATYLADESKRLGVLNGMFYTDEVDALITRYHGRQHVKVFSADKAELDLKLLEMNRVDYFLGMPSQLTPQSSTPSTEPYLFYNIAEIRHFLPMYTHCSNTPLGQAVVSKLNALLTPAKLHELMQAYRPWFGQSMHFEKLYRHYVIEGKPHDLVRDPPLIGMNK